MSQDANQLGAQRDAIDRWIDRGISGYPAFQRRLADSVSPAEAVEASRLTRTALYALGFALTVQLLLALNIPRLKTWYSPEEAISWLSVPTLLFSLILIGRFHVPFAGRVLFTFLAIAEVVFEPANWRDLAGYLKAAMAPGDVFEGLIMFGGGYQLMGFMLAGYLLGAGVDIGASLKPNRRVARRLLLIALGVLMLLTYTQEPQLAYPVFAFILLLWIWPLGGWFARRSTVKNEDVSILTGAAFKRWRRNSTGRLLAVVTVATSGVTFLNSFDYRETLLKAPHSAEFFHEDPAAAHPEEAMAYFWVRQRSFLGKAEFSSAYAGFYTLSETALADPKLIEAALDRIEGNESIFGSRQLEEQAYAKILPELKRLDNPAAFHAAWQKRDPVWAINHPNHLAPHIVERLDVGGHVKTMSRSEIETDLEFMPLLQIGIASCALLAYVLLWRRGGDTPIAAWTGIWLSGIAAVFTFSSFHFSFFPILLSISAIPSPAECMLMGGIAVLMGFSILLAGLSFSGVAPWAVLFHLRRLREDQAATEEINTWWRRIPMALKFWSAAIITLILSLFFDLDAGAPVWMLYAFLSGALLMGVIALIRRLARRGMALKPLPPSLVLAFVAAMAMTWTAIWVLNTEPLPRYALTIVGLNAAVLVALGGWIILRDNFLHIAGGRDLSYLLTALMLPIGFEILDDLIDEMVWRTGLFSLGAGGIASMIVVVTLLPPLQRALESLLFYISNPRLYRMRHWIEEMVEQCALTHDLPSTASLLDKFFDKFKMRRYAFLKRISTAEFRVQVNCLEKEFAKPVELSLSLRKHLAKTVGFVDLEQVAYEWEHFFEQFELYRLQQELGVRYLLPIRIGDSLQGLLLLPDEVPARNFSKEGMVNFVNHLGIMTTQRAH